MMGKKEQNSQCPSSRGIVALGCLLAAPHRPSTRRTKTGSTTPPAKAYVLAVQAEFAYYFEQRGIHVHTDDRDIRGGGLNVTFPREDGEKRQSHDRVGCGHGFDCGVKVR